MRTRNKTNDLVIGELCRTWKKGIGELLSGNEEFLSGIGELLSGIGELLMRERQKQMIS